MGFFRDIGELHRMGREAHNSLEAGARMTKAMDGMQELQAWIARQTAAANVAATGMPGTATVVAVRQTRHLVNHQPVAEVDLTVFPPSAAPYPATVSQPMPIQLAGKLAPGASLQVKIDQQNPQTIWIDPTS